ncbi:MAG TPA: pyridine nucleotide-disulfide oxidoreductase [Microbacteriaceae bacterium]|jgi:hypothetical protein|nr:pyridine nucleotide-disulfide oxidoreductase [Microbacteriaceae bacterium]HQX36722.1 pyridine nucleotide-disulfide oxidoreductase [Microbacteriaceae bacterium]HQZ47721.1 pyridine nucleotide-disulfide oxidoreductase [Microbacteriaceae bacterium]HRA10008.1 pyridine nucleotide-disulfide oxidoreductase [Microbacteriaceae bacterium]
MTEARANSTLEVDYLVIGAGAMGMAFVDTLLSETDATIAIIDRNHKPGGHWTNAYPFVRLHQPSVFYGVISKGLGTGAIDADGPNAGLNELASADEILDYFDHVMRDTFLKSGRVSYFPMSNYDGADPARLGVERFHSLVTGAPTDVIVGRRVVDATYQNVSIPATTPPRYEFADGVEVVPPNALVKLSSPWARYTVVGSGKTGIDACLWLLEHDVDPDNITWIMPRDAWLLDRAGIQPKPAGVAPGNRGVWLQGALEATEIDQVLEAFEAAGMVMRLTPDVRPTAYRCATVTHAEIASLRRIKNIVRRGRVKRLNVDSIELDDATIPAHPDTLYIDCTSDGLERRPTVPVYEGSKITLQCIIPCQQVFSAALIAHIEATTADDATRNEVCVPAPHPDSAQDLLGYMIEIAERVAQWGSDAELLAWLNQSRSVITFPAEVDLPRQQMAGELVAKVRAKYADILAWDAAIVS